MYGLPCNHTLVVAKIFSPTWPYITLYDISVRWLKSYYLYSLPDKIIPDEIMQRKVKQVSKLPCRKEVIGIHITESTYDHIQIHEGPIPD